MVESQVVKNCFSFYHWYAENIIHSSVLIKKFDNNMNKNILCLFLNIYSTEMKWEKQAYMNLSPIFPTHVTSLVSSFMNIYAIFTLLQRSLIYRHADKIVISIFMSHVKFQFLTNSITFGIIIYHCFLGDIAMVVWILNVQHNCNQQYNLIFKVKTCSTFIHNNLSIEYYTMT